MQRMNLKARSCEKMMMYSVILWQNATLHCSAILQIDVLADKKTKRAMMPVSSSGTAECYDINAHFFHSHCTCIEMIVFETI